MEDVTVESAGVVPRYVTPLSALFSGRVIIAGVARVAPIPPMPSSGEPIGTGDSVGASNGEFVGLYVASSIQLGVGAWVVVAAMWYTGLSVGSVAMGCTAGLIVAWKGVDRGAGDTAGECVNPVGNTNGVGEIVVAAVGDGTGLMVGDVVGVAVGVQSRHWHKLIPGTYRYVAQPLRSNTNVDSKLKLGPPSASVTCQQDHAKSESIKMSM